MVPIVSKKSASMSEKTSRSRRRRRAAEATGRVHLCPAWPNTGTAIGEPLSSGTAWPQPVGSSRDAIDVGEARTMTARIVEAMIEIRPYPSPAHVEDHHEEQAKHERGPPAVERARDAELTGGRAGGTMPASAPMMTRAPPSYTSEAGTARSSWPVSLKMRMGPPVSMPMASP